MSAAIPLRDEFAPGEDIEALRELVCRSAQVWITPRAVDIDI